MKKMKNYTNVPNLSFMILFALINIFNAFIFLNTESAKIEVLSSRISKTAKLYSSTESLNMNMIGKGNADDNYASVREKLQYGYRLSQTAKRVGPHYNARVSFIPNSETYYESEMLYFKKPSIILSNSFSNHLNNNGETVHDLFELKLMYRASNSDYKNFNNFCYITQKQANYIISQNTNYLNYEDIINEPLKILFCHGEESIFLNWKIANIILDDEGIDSFLNKTYGDYLIAYTSLPRYNNISFDFDFGVSELTNYKKIKELLPLFPSNKYYFSLNTFNSPKIDSSEIEKIISEYTNINLEEDVQLINLILLFVSGILILAFLGGFFFLSKKNIIKLSPFYILFFILCFFIIYYAFRILFLINLEFIIFFTLGSIVLNLSFVLLVVIIATYIYKKRAFQWHSLNKKPMRTDENFYIPKYKK